MIGGYEAEAEAEAGGTMTTPTKTTGTHQNDVRGDEIIVVRTVVTVVAATRHPCHHRNRRLAIGDIIIQRRSTVRKK